DDHPVQVWSLATFRAGPALQGQPARGSFCYGFSPDSRFLVGGIDVDATLVWDVLTGQLVRRFTGHVAGITTACFGRDSHTLFTGGSESVIQRWDLRHGLLAAETTAVARQEWWADLGDGEAKVALRAVWNLARTPTETAALAGTS